MGFTFIASASGDRDAAGSTLDCSSDLNVLAGDLLVVFVRWWQIDRTISVAEVGAGNSFTMRTTQIPSIYLHLASGYVLAATEDSTATFRATWNGTVEYSGLTVLQFRPDSGETVTFEDDTPNSGISTVALTGAASAVGNDILAVSGHSYHYWWQLAEFVNVAMAGGEPDDYIYDRSPVNINLVTMYKAFAESQTDITAEYEQTDSDTFAANILMFKSAGVLPKQDSFTTDTPDKSLDVYDSGWVIVGGAFTVRAATDDVEQVDAGTSMAYWGDNVFNDDQYAEVKIKNISVEIGVGVRLNNVSGGNGYFFFATNSNSYFGTITNGTWADISGGHGAFAVDDVIRLEFVGTTWTLKKNGGVLDSGIDSTHASGAAGITAWSGGAARVDDFEGGNIGAVTHQLAGSIDSISLLSGRINVERSLIGSANSVSLLSGLINIAIKLAGSADSISLLAGDLTVIPAGGVTHYLEGSIDSVSLLAGELNLKHGLAGLITSVSNAQGVINVTRNLLGRLDSISFISGSLSIKLELIGGISSSSFLAGILTLESEKGLGELIEVFGEFTQLVEIAGEFAQVIEVNGEFAQLVEVFGELREE